MKTLSRLVRGALATCAWGAALLPLPGPLAAQPVEVSFTAAQAEAGARAYRRSCAGCHGRELQGEGIAPSLTGDRWAMRWAGKSVEVLLPHLRRMPLPPLGEPGSLTDETYAQILAFMVQRSGVAAGAAPLPIAPADLAALRLPGGAARDTRAPRRPSASARAELLRALPPVTPEMLTEPGPEDWLTWRRTYDMLGHSPLDQIDARNVGQLEVAWTAPLQDGESMPSPLVHRGVMFLHTYPDTTLALDASTGAELWRFQYEPKATPGKKMGLALAGDKLIVPTSDLHLVALDLRTGEPIWDHDIRTEVPKEGANYQLRAAPLVVGGKVLQGIQSFRVARGSFIVAVDLETGEESWRFNTVAWPGETGGNTWNDIPLDARNGGSIWVTGSFDPELGLVYFGPAPTYDTAPLLVPSEKEGVTNDALFTNTTVALDAETGELRWHFQHLQNDQWDLDWAFERQIVELEVAGAPRRAVVTVGKAAIVEAVDAKTGEYLFSIDLGLQNVIESIDPETGRKTVWSDSDPDLERPRLICPTAVGARSWPPTSLNPATGRLFLPLTEGCMIGGDEGFKGLLTTGIGLSMAPHPASSDGNMGRLQAVDLETRQMKWSHRQAAPFVSAALSTDGGVVWAGDLEPSLKAFDQQSGDLLWRAPLADTPGSNVITYEASGTQYVALVVGQPNNVSRDWGRIWAQFVARRGETFPELPKGGAAVVAFALPESAR